jgi:hypothetical protein
VPDGSAEIPLQWRGMFLALSALAMLVAGGVLLVRWPWGTKRDP